MATKSKKETQKADKSVDEMMIRILRAEASATTKNILAPGLAGDNKGKPLFVAKHEIRCVTQNIIDLIDDHRYLRNAMFLVLVELGWKPDADGLLKLGQAKVASHMDRTLVARDLEDLPDFIITLNGDTLMDDDGELDVTVLIPLLDHELSHCRPVIAGRYVKFSAIAKLLGDLGDDYIDQPEGEKDDKGRQLVRYLKRDGKVPLGEEGYHDQPFKWRTAKHQITEFVNVAGRWGTRCHHVQALVDVMEKAIDHDGQMELFEGKNPDAAEAAA